MLDASVDSRRSVGAFHRNYATVELISILNDHARERLGIQDVDPEAKTRKTRSDLDQGKIGHQ
jgi:hypothetical protein